MSVDAETSAPEGVAPVVLQVLPALNTGGVERGTVDIAEAVVEAGGTTLVASEGGRLMHELQRAVSVLWRNTNAGSCTALQSAFHASRIRIGAMMYQRAGQQNLRNEQLADELRLSCERLATSLERLAKQIHDIAARVEAA